MKKAWKAKLLTALCCNLFFFALLLVFSPLEVFVGNVNEFKFPLDNVWWIMLLTALCATGMLTALEMLLPASWALLANAATAGLGLCCYVQTMFLNGKMVSMDVEALVTNRTERLINLGVWALILLVVCAAAVYAIAKNKKGTAHAVLRYICLVLTGIQAFALIVTVATTDLNKERDSFKLVGDGQFELAPKQNTLVFVLDTTDSAYMDAALEQFPDIHQAFSGFTYYHNATSGYSRTFPAIPYMLTGEKYYFDRFYGEYIDEAYNKGTLIKELGEAGVDSRIFTIDSNLISEYVSRYLGNTTTNQSKYLKNTSIPDLIKGMLRVSLYKVAPYRLKYELEYSVSEINQSVVRIDGEAFEYVDYNFYQELMSHPLTLSKEYDKAFRFYHLYGSHYRVHWNENMELDENATEPPALRGSLRIIEEYMRRMDEMGILDDATIIITADHGDSAAGQALTVFGTVLTPPKPVLMVKYPHSDMSRPLEISNAPVSHEELRATIAKACGIEHEKHGRTFQEIGEDEQRERHYYYTALFHDREGEIALKEYVINGDANDFANWTDTGNYWDVNYSAYKVSPLRYKDILAERAK